MKLVSPMDAASALELFLLDSNIGLGVSSPKPSAMRSGIAMAISGE